METALAPPIEHSKLPQIVPPIPEKPVPKPGPAELPINLVTVAKAVGNLAVQRAVEAEVIDSSILGEKAPASSQEDPVHQVVTKDMGVKAKTQKTPVKTPEEKRDETVAAAKEESRNVTNKQKGYENRLKKLDEVQPREFTVPEFMGEFDAAVKKLAQKIPTNNSDEQRAVFEGAQQKATQDVGAQGESHSKPMRDEADKDPKELPDNEKEKATGAKLELDPSGNVPTIKQAKAAAPKPQPDKAISLDDKSRELDDALQNNDVAGQKISIDEGSLAFPVSGEKSFDDAGETKRQAQAEIAKAKPRYRQEEKVVIGSAQNDMNSLVNIRGLQGHHGLRSQGFKDVLGAQNKHKTQIKSVKASFMERIEGVYKDTKVKVDEALDTLTEGYTIEEELEWILTDADTWFKWWTRKNLEYIYPGAFEYSDFTEDYKNRILAEYKQLIGEKYRDVDEALEQLSTKHKTLGDIGKKIREIGGADVNLYFKALSNVQSQVALEFFEIAKNHFIFLVVSDVEKKIARRVVIAVNQARRAIAKGKDDVEKIYAELSPDEQKEVEDVYTGAKDRFDELQKSVDERQREIVADMARTYNKSVGKLKATFDEISEDVQTSWLKKAWNKIKAVVNAIIDFATRIAELLGKMIGLLGDIISSPRAFFRNLANGISEGFAEFGRRIDEFLATAFFDWIRGTSGVQVQFPKEFNAAGIFSLFTQLLNLSTETIWQRMEVVYDKSVANAFRQGEVVLDKGLEIFDIIKREGLGGLWDHIVESLGTLLSDTLDEMKETVLYAAIKKVMIEIGKLLIPGGGFIAIAEKVIRLLVFIVEARNKILDLIEAFVLSMENAVNGDIAGIVKLVTSALTKFITVALDFLVAFFGLSDLKAKVERFIERMRSPVIRGIDFVLKKFKPLVMKGKELVAKGTEKVVGAGKRIASAVRRWLGLEKKFVANDGMEHKLYFAGSETKPILMIQTHTTPFGTFIQNVDVGTDDKKIKAKALALPIAQDIDKKRLEPLEGTTEEEKERSKEQKLLEVEKLLGDLAVHTKLLFGELLGIPEPEIHNNAQSAGFGITMTAARLNKKQKVQGSRPTGSKNSSFEILNRRRQEGNPTAAYYMKGHLLNEDVGGQGIWKNLTPLSRKGNSAHESQVEALVKAAFQSGAAVEYNVTVTYGYGQNEGQIPAEDPKAAEKKQVIKEEANVPTNLRCEAFVMDKLEDGSFGRKPGNIVKAEVANPIGQNAASYTFSDTPAREIIYLNNTKPENENKIATIEGLDSNMAWKIVVAHKELRDSTRFNSYEELSDARDFARDRIFATRPEQEQVLALKKLKYVKLYEGEGGKTAEAAEPEIPAVLTD